LQPVEKQCFAVSRENNAKKTCGAGGVLYLPHISRRAANTNRPNQMQTSSIKFGFRQGNQKRGKIITGMTVRDYIESLGASDYVLTPNGGWFRIGNKTSEFAITIY
jgi:hypothetical protein